MTSAINYDEDWVRLPKLGCQTLGLGRTYLFNLAKKGLIKSVALRQAGKKRGVRLISLRSVRAFIEVEATRQIEGDASSTMGPAAQPRSLP